MVITEELLDAMADGHASAIVYGHGASGNKLCESVREELRQAYIEGFKTGFKMARKDYTIEPEAQS